MPRQGLNKEAVVKKAAEMIDRRGPDFFSVAGLAESLGVKPSSLYNHIDSLERIKAGVARRAADMLSEALSQSREGKTRGDAVRALALRYRDFGVSHRHLYRMIMSPTTIREEKDLLLEPILASFSGFSLPAEEKMHRQRILRALADGFIADEVRGFFSEFDRPPLESFEKAVNIFVLGLEEAEKTRERGK